MSTCSRCGTTFTCGMADAPQGGTPGDAAPCWCTQFPPMPMPAADDREAACYCPACLRALTDSLPRPTAPAR